MTVGESRKVSDDEIRLFVGGEFINAVAVALYPLPNHKPTNQPTNSPQSSFLADP